MTIDYKQLDKEAKVGHNVPDYKLLDKEAGMKYGALDKEAALNILDKPELPRPEFPGVTATGIRGVPLEPELPRPQFPSETPRDIRPPKDTRLGLPSRIGGTLIKAFAVPPSVRTADIRAAEAQRARMKKRRKQGVPRFNEISLDDESKDIKWQLTHRPEARDEDLRAIPITTEEPLGFQAPPPERDAEGALTARGRVEAGSDIAVGVASFITKLVLSKKVFGGAPAVARWEAINLAEGGPVGKGAGVRAGLGWVSKVPTLTAIGKATKIAAGGGFFGTITALEGGDFVDVTVSTIIGAGFQAWGINKQNNFLKRYKTE